MTQSTKTAIKRNEHVSSSEDRVRTTPVNNTVQQGFFSTQNQRGLNVNEVYVIIRERLDDEHRYESIIEIEHGIFLKKENAQKVTYRLNRIAENGVKLNKHYKNFLNYYGRFTVEAIEIEDSEEVDYTEKGN